MKTLNPDNVVKPASNYVQGVVHAAAAGGKIGAAGLYRKHGDRESLFVELEVHRPGDGVRATFEDTR